MKHSALTYFVNNIPIYVL